jgi:hypothetical protein
MQSTSELYKPIEFLKNINCNIWTYIPSIKKCKVKYIHEWILKSQEEHVWEGIKSLNAFVVNNIISQCISHNNILCLENISHKKEMSFTKKWEHTWRN